MDTVILNKNSMRYRSYMFLRSIFTRFHSIPITNCEFNFNHTIWILQALLFGTLAGLMLISIFPAGLILFNVIDAGSIPIYMLILGVMPYLIVTVVGGVALVMGTVVGIVLAICWLYNKAVGGIQSQFTVCKQLVIKD